MNAKLELIDALNTLPARTPLVHMFVNVMLVLMAMALIAKMLTSVQLLPTVAPVMQNAPTQSGLSNAIVLMASKATVKPVLILTSVTQATINVTTTQSA